MEQRVYGLSYLTELSLSALERCKLEIDDRRTIMYSLYGFAGLLQPSFIGMPSEVLFNNEVCFKVPFGGGEVPKDALTVREGEREWLRFDRGGETYFYYKERGMIASGNGADTLTKLDLFTMVYRIVTLGTANEELKALWFIFFPYVLALEPPYNEAVYVKLKKELLDESLYPQVLKSKYSDIIYDTVKEMVLGGVPPLITDWYIEYVEWKNVKDERGISREVAKYQRILALGDFEYVLKGSEKLLDSFPDDENIVLMNLAARVSLGKQNEKLLTEAAIIAEEWLKRNSGRRVYYAYYLGLSYMGLKQVEKAEKCFKLCLEFQPDFELADFMLRGLDKIKHS